MTRLIADIEISPNTRTHICTDCEKEFTFKVKRGRPPVRCPSCRAERATPVKSPMPYEKRLKKAHKARKSKIQKKEAYNKACLEYEINKPIIPMTFETGPEELTQELNETWQKIQLAQNKSFLRTLKIEKLRKGNKQGKEKIMSALQEQREDIKEEISNLWDKHLKIRLLIVDEDTAKRYQVPKPVPSEFGL